MGLDQSCGLVGMCVGRRLSTLGALGPAQPLAAGAATKGVPAHRGGSRGLRAVARATCGKPTDRLFSETAGIAAHALAQLTPLSG